MPPASAHYTLVGFSDGLDWRPLSFVRPIPKYRVCSACGLVRKKLALLPCAHTLCDACCQQCFQTGTSSCPLDSEEFREEDVEQKENPVDEVLTREVRCWNHERGCPDMMVASELLKHIQNQCGYHCTSCPRCSATIPCGDVCSHLRSDCSGVIASDPCEDPHGSSEAATLANLKTLLEAGLTEIKSGLQQVVSESKAQSQALSAACHGVSSLRETIQEKFSEAAQGSRDSFARYVTETCRAVKEDVKDCLNRPCNTLNEISACMHSVKENLQQDVEAAAKRNRDAIEKHSVKIQELQTEIRNNDQKVSCNLEKMLSQISFNTSACHFRVENVSSLKDTAMKNEVAYFSCDPVYLRGYYMSPGVQFKKTESAVSLNMRVVINKGAMDEFLQWPFSLTVKLSVIHPGSGKEKHDIYLCPQKERKNFAKPSVSLKTD